MAKTKAKKPKRPLPTRAEILDFIAISPVPVGKREIARAFKVAPADRVALKGIIKDIERSSSAERGHKRRLHPVGALPETSMLEIVEIDRDGDVFAKPLPWNETGEPPRIVVLDERGRTPSVAVGERVVARLARLDSAHYEARVVRSLAGRTADRLLGVYRATGEGGMVEPADRRQKHKFSVLPADSAGSQDGELVAVEALPARRFGLPQARIVERLGDTNDPKSISLIAIHSHGIPTEFSQAALDLAAAAQPVELGARTDLRSFPLVTIDGSDARDFDDAVWAAPDDDPENEGGWHVLVAIADVSWYVRPGDALDRAAEERGNSVYFPDRVVPMLPEALSNELCSLKPKVERACMAVHMWFTAQGKKLRHRFVRGLMRSAARLTYEEVQRAVDGHPDDATGPLLDPVIRPLYGAYAALDKARRRRGTLELDLPERRVVLDEAGNVARIEPRQRLDSHKLIEEFMIAANVAAAEALEAMRRPCMYRVHDSPDPAKLQALEDFLAGLDVPGLHLAKGQNVKPRDFNRILGAAAETPYAVVVNELVLRSQAQAVYSPQNIGHFGLALKRYAHFTSPIRRYADLLVHRALVAGGDFGAGGLPEIDPKAFAEIGEHISVAERRAAAAERGAVDRYLIAFLSDRVGATFRGRVTGVTRFGLFATLAETGADGLIPIGRLGADYFVHDEAGQRLVGRRTGTVYTLGDDVEVRLEEADRVTGSLVFSLVTEEGVQYHPAGRRPPPGRPAGVERGRERDKKKARRR